MDDSTKLFGTKTIGDWRVVRDKIKANPEVEGNWIEATNLLELRLERRYFQPIERILNIQTQNSEGSFCGFIDNILGEIGLQCTPVVEEKSVMGLSGEGFAAMTLICSLIEFLQSCYEGRKYKNENKIKNLTLDFEYNHSGVIFKRFLECHEPFKSQLTNTALNKTYFEDFYSNVRSGLLHEAATNNDWVINQKHSEHFIDVNDENRKIIYRDNFFKAIKVYFAEYKQKIIDDKKATIQIRDEPKTIHLRHAFCRKIDFLCDIAECDRIDRSPDWWNIDKIYIETT